MKSPVFLQLLALAPAKKQADNANDFVEQGRGLVLVRYMDKVSLVESLIPPSRQYYTEIVIARGESSAGTSSNLR